MALTSPRFTGSDRLHKAAENNPVMAYGESGEAVRIVQQALIDLGYPMPISTKKYNSPDGIFGSETAGRVKEFQRKERLSADKIVGRNTMARLDQLLPGAAPKLPPLPKDKRYTHRIRLHLHSVVSPKIGEYRQVKAAQEIFKRYKIRVEVASGQSLMLPKGPIDLKTINGECNWDQTNDEQKLLFGLGQRVNKGPSDIRVYYVHEIRRKDGSKVGGCAGHEPGDAAVIVDATTTRWAMAHEIGHVLLGSGYRPVHHASTRNLMYDTDITRSRPTLTPDQVTAMKKSRYCVAI